MSEQKKVLEQLNEMQLHITFKSRIRLMFKNLVYNDESEETLPLGEKRYNFILCRFCWRIVQFPLFNTFIMMLILANTVILATDAYPEPQEDLIKMTNKFFTFAFTGECIIKIIGLTFRQWRNEIFNIFDLAIVVASFVEMWLSESETAIIGALRSIRLLRLIKLVRSNYTLKCLLDAIAITMAQCANFIVILGLFIYVFSLLGMEIFAEHFKFDSLGRFQPVTGSVPRQNYDEIFSAILTVFQVLVGEKWNEIMYLGYQARQEIAVAYFMFLVLLGRIILLNLFLAILLGYFEQASQQIREEQEEKMIEEFQKSKFLETMHKKRNDDKSPQFLDGEDRQIINLQPIMNNSSIGKRRAKVRQENLLERTILPNDGNNMLDSSYDSGFDMRAEYNKNGNNEETFSQDSENNNPNELGLNFTTKAGIAKKKYEEGEDENLETDRDQFNSARYLVDKPQSA